MTTRDDPHDEIEDDRTVADDLELDEDAEQVDGGRGSGAGKANL